MNTNTHNATDWFVVKPDPLGANAGDPKSEFRNPQWVVWVAGVLTCAAVLTAAMPVVAAEVIGGEALLEHDGSVLWRAIVNFAPADGAAADVNPPRFRWYYVPDPSRLSGDSRVLYKFRLQIARDASFEDLIVDVETEFNFYNALAPLPEPGEYVWRVGYLCQMASWDGRQVSIPREQTPGTWSAVRRFTIAADTPAWDRSALRDVNIGPHPRLGFRQADLARLRELPALDPIAAKVFRTSILPDAERIARETVWNDWPATDTGTEIKGYYTAGRALIRAAFAFLVSGDRRFANAPAIFARIATYPPGGRSSPEGMGGDSVEDSTSLTEFLALAYDWFHDQYTPEQRQAFETSLEWRIKKWLHEFRWGGAWYTPFQRGGYDGPSVSPASLFMAGGDHHWEGSLATFPAAIALYDKSEVAREYFHLMANYLIGVGERAAQDGCGDLGLSYGQSHLKWMLFQSVYLDAALPELNIGRNPWYRRVARFYIAATPFPMPSAPWGRDDGYGMWWEHRRESFGLLAALTGDPAAEQAWEQVAGKGTFWWRPWVHVFGRLRPRRWNDLPAGVGTDLFLPSAGWVMSHSEDPLNRGAYNRGVGVTFVCRPGHHGNTFFSNNSFQMYAYGQTINHGGGGAEDPLPFHTMSHNTILVDGLGQAYGPGGEGYHGALVAYKKTDDYVYWVGDATGWYPRVPNRIQTWKLRFDTNIYGVRDASHLKRYRRHMLFVRKRYLVVLDDLEASRPAKFTWLWHVLQPGPLNYDAETGLLHYIAGDVPVLVRHVAGVEQLEFRDQPREGWLKNEITGEDFAQDKHTRREVLDKERARQIIPAHNVWLTTREPVERRHFLAVVYPAPPGGKPPEIKRLDDWTVRVRDGEREDVISFDPNTTHPATIRIDLPAMQQPFEISSELQLPSSKQGRK